MVIQSVSTLKIIFRAKKNLSTATQKWNAKLWKETTTLTSKTIWRASTWRTISTMSQLSTQNGTVRVSLGKYLTLVKMVKMNCSLAKMNSHGATIREAASRSQETSRLKSIQKTAMLVILYNWKEKLATARIWVNWQIKCPVLWWKIREASFGSEDRKEHWEGPQTVLHKLSPEFAWDIR